MNPTKTGLYTTTADGRTLLLYWDGEDWVDQDGIRPCYKEVHWTGKPLFVPALRTWVGLTDAQRDDIYFCVEGGASALETWQEQARAIECKLKEKNA